MSSLRTIVGAGLASLAVAGVIAAPAFGSPSAAARPTAHVQAWTISITPAGTTGFHEAVSTRNLAIAAGLPVRITLTNFTAQFHSFTIPGLGVSALLRPAHGSTPSRTTLTFTTNSPAAIFEWFCAICDSGGHGPKKMHDMNGEVYVIINPLAFAA